MKTGLTPLLQDNRYNQGRKQEGKARSFDRGGECRSPKAESRF
jgi:hypothetical protein